MSLFSSEFAYMSKVTTKVDVFSFGILVMEFLTKQRPTGFIEESGTPISLRQLVERALENGRDELIQIIDPELVLNVSKQEKETLEELLKLALLCTDSNPENRPNMKDVVTILSKL